MNEWETIKLGKVFKLTSGKSKTKKLLHPFSEEHPYPVFGGNGINGYTNEWLVDKDVIVIGRVGEYCGVVHRTNGPTWITDNALYTQQFLVNTDITFTFYLLTYHQLGKLRSQSGQPLVSQKPIYEYEVKLPSLIEQEKISAILISVEDAIEKTEAIIEQTEKVKKGLMQQLLTRGIGHTKFKKTEIGEIPEEWELLKFKDVCKIVNGQVDPKVEPYSDMPHIGNANIEKFSGRLLEYRTAKEDQQTSGKYLFNESHVLYGKINPHFGKVAFPQFSGLCSADVYPIETSDKLLPYYLKYLLLDTRFFTYTVSVSGRTGIPKVNRQDLEIYKFSIPPVNEQKKIVKVLTAIDDRLIKERDYFTQLRELKKGLMQVLLTGKVRVKVDEEEMITS